MVQKTDLLGLGMNPFMANILAPGIVNITATGSNRATSASIGQNNRGAVITASAAGTGIILPGSGGDTGALLADTYTVYNTTANSVQLYAPGSMVFQGAGAAQVSGATGVPIPANTRITVTLISNTAWAYGTAA